ncbi:hypothetical protein V495_00240 [Pseudogymnoascus sp. VKM F-4514 (FW-929)]|nr:hypothetical protein V495_00240 [Pseudogymnoascus sp. VKM F-4514 (FW-929)]KFY67199.1 hypothetical protein V497_00506 [Pseudogymnoascus sp. VKM F-4516 (FW-969)]
MAELAEIFDELDLARYLDSFLEQGFDTWDSILDITEPDFDALGVKLGHRRKLQRKIAATRGISHAQALAPPKRSLPGLDHKLLNESKGVAAPRSEGTRGSSSIQLSGKRKYARHPKPDQNSPARSRSAYLLFSNKVREDLKGESLSFTEITKLVGKRWQHITPSEKELYTQQSSVEKETSRTELAEYRMTKNYKTYSDYLLEFQAKQLQESNQQLPCETSEELKLQIIPSATRTSTATCSTTSTRNHEDLTGMRTRDPSLNSIPRPSFSSEPTTQTAAEPSTQAQASEDAPSSALTGYCDMVTGANPQMFAWSGDARPTDIPWVLEPNFTTWYSPPKSHNTPTMDGDLTSVDSISEILRAGEVFSSQGQLAHNQHQPAEHMVASPNDWCEE